MKKHGILNSSIDKVLADLGHTDMVVIADAGLPIPKDVEKIDISLEFGKPSFEEVLKLLCREMEIEEVTIAKEIVECNETQYKNIKNLLKKDKRINYVTHKEFKNLTKNARVVIRTGEVTPYSNIILHAGVIF